MHKTQTPVFQNIPFVAGKSLNKSHNIGVRIQQTKSLMSTQLNKKPKPKQKPQLQPADVDDDCWKMQSSSTSVMTRQRQTDTNDTCPVLKHHVQANPNFYDETENDFEKKNDEENKTIEEIWAEYMFQVESKNVIPVKCTCFPLNTKKHSHKHNKNAVHDHASKKPGRTKNDRSTIYLEARKVMNECRGALNSSDEEIVSKEDGTSLDEDLNKKPTRTTKMARYMRQIKQIQERLTG